MVDMEEENTRNKLIALKPSKDSVFKVRHPKTVLYRLNSGADRDMHKRHLRAFEF